MWDKFFINNHGCPCKKDCPDRSAVCRKTCEKFKKYDQKRIDDSRKKLYNEDVDKFNVPMTAAKERRIRSNDELKRRKGLGYKV